MIIPDLCLDINRSTYTIVPLNNEWLTIRYAGPSNENEDAMR